MGDTIDDEFGPIGVSEVTTYHASGVILLLRTFAMFIGGVFALITTQFLLLGLLTLALSASLVVSTLTGASLLDADPAWRASMWLILIVAAAGAGSVLVAVLYGLIAWAMLRFTFTAPTRITLAGDGRIAFRGWWRTIELHPADVHSVATGAWYGPRRCSVAVRYQGGAIAFLNLFHDFPDFLHRLKALNPAVDLKGF